LRTQDSDVGDHWKPIEQKQALGPLLDPLLLGMVRQLMMLPTIGCPMITGVVEDVPVLPVEFVVAGATIVVVLVVVVDVVVVPGVMVVPVVLVVMGAMQLDPFQMNPVIQTQEFTSLFTPAVFKIREQLR
jgi:hypothetical protein